MTDTTSTESKGHSLGVQPKLVTLDGGRQIFSTGGPAKSTGRQPPALIPLDGGSRKITSTGRWNDGLLLGYLIEAETEYQANLDKATDREKARERFGRGWVEVGELARVAYGQNSLDSKRKVRTRLSNLFWFALLHNVVLNLDYDFGGGHGRIVAAKVFDQTDAVELEKLAAKLTKLRDSSELTNDQYNKAVELSGIVRKDDEAA